MKERIIKTLLNILRTQGLKFTTNDLAKSLRISKSTLYANFKSKDELLEEMVDYVFATLDSEEQAILQSPDASLEEKLIATISIYPKDLGPFQNHVYQYLYNMPTIREKAMAYNKRRFEHFNALLDEGVEQGIIRKNVPRSMFFQLLLLAQRGLMDPHTLATLNITYSDATNEALQILLHGIITKEND